MQFTLYVPDDLATKINERLPRTLKISTMSRWLLMGLTLSPGEIASYCRENESEAAIVWPFLHEALEKLFEAGKIIERNK
jgi:hypothetical protein